MGGVGGGEWIGQKRKIRDESIFSDNVEWISKYLWKMTSADVKANINNKK